MISSLQSNLLVIGCGRNIMNVWMELDCINIREMAGENSQRNVLLSLPEFGSAIV